MVLEDLLNLSERSPNISLSNLSSIYGENINPNLEVPFIKSESSIDKNSGASYNSPISPRLKGKVPKLDLNFVFPNKVKQ